MCISAEVIHLAISSSTTWLENALFMTYFHTSESDIKDQ